MGLKRADTLKVISAGVDALAQDQSRRNVEDYLKGVDVIKLAEALAQTNLALIREEIAIGIKLNVNGKLDKMQQGLDIHNAKHEANFSRMLPGIEAFEEWQNDKKVAQKGGKIVLWVAATITAIGGSILILRAVFTGN